MMTLQDAIAEVKRDGWEEHWPVGGGASALILQAATSGDLIPKAPDEAEVARLKEALRDIAGGGMQLFNRPRRPHHAREGRHAMTAFLNIIAAFWAGMSSWAFLTGFNQDRALDGMQLAVLIAIYARLHK